VGLCGGGPWPSLTFDPFFDVRTRDVAPRFRRRLGIAAAPNQVLLPAAAAPTSIKCGVRVLTSAMPAVFAPLLAMGSRRVFVGVWAFAMGMPAIPPSPQSPEQIFWLG
jgi:hypothetical protein